MDQWEDHITPILVDFERFINYTFPNTAPEYDSFGVTGWGPDYDEMKVATRDILTKIENVLDITFIETNDEKATNVISVSTSNQTNLAGFSYFPNNFRNWHGCIHC